MTEDRTGAATVLDRCLQLDRHSAHPKRLERAYLTPQHAAANAATARWMQEAGLSTRVDAAGNLWGRIEGAAAGLPAVVLGSHLDTVPDAGSYDGMLGVLMATAVVERLRERIGDWPVAVEVAGFNDEEGTRFGKALLGSSAVAGSWQEDWWDLRDRDGVSLFQAFRDFGLDPRAVADAARQPAGVLAYLEAHIEQGPHLEAADRSLGYVTSIAGARRFVLSVIGESRHAGGTPFERRRDALVGASEAILLIERLAREGVGIATVGQISVLPGGVNVVPGRADFSLDLRAEEDRVRDALWDAYECEIAALCSRRGLRFSWRESHSAPAMPCAPWLQQAVIDGIAVTGDHEPMGLWSRAGHDGMAIGAITDVGMLFVRCHDGISHHPDESVREIDVDRGIDALEAALVAVVDRIGADAPRTSGAR